MAAVDLYWLPLGAGGHCVRTSGRLFEAVAAMIEHRPRCSLYHSALEVRVGDERHVIEMAPVWNEPSPDRGVVSEGAVGSRLAGRSRLFRYEIRCWNGGRIPDVAEAVDSPRRLSEADDCARHVLDLVPQVPTPVWNLDWNSNSVIAWLLVRSGIDVAAVRPPAGGLAPGWDAGARAARSCSAASTSRTRRR
jgi:hypothetical protein